MSYSEEEYRRAIANARDHCWADMIVLAIGLAAETHPEVVQTALAKVFDLKAVEDTSRRAMKVLAHQRFLAMELRHMLIDLHKDLDSMVDKMEQLRHQVLTRPAAQPAPRVKPP